MAGLATLLTSISVARASAQSATEWVSRGSAAYVARNPSEALADFEKALALEPRNYDALWNAARAAVELGEFNPSEQERSSLYTTAADRAKLATQVNPGGADGHFALALALGRQALTLGARDRIRYAGTIHDEAMTCLKIEPKHAGCLHVMGEWNAEIMRLSGLTRMIARNFLGGKIFGEASWANAEHYLEDAVASEPRRIVHRLDLGRVYADMGLKAQARTEFEAVINGELIDYNDPHYKVEAADDLKKL